MDASNNERQNLNPAERDRDDQRADEEWVRSGMWVWEQVLTRVKRNIGNLERRLDNNLMIHQDVRHTMNQFQQLRQRGQQNNAAYDYFPPGQMARVIMLMAKALNRLDELAVSMADYSKEFYHIRRNLGLLEERLNRDMKDEGLGDEDQEDPIKIALDYMTHVDDILNRITRWEEEDEGAQA